MGEGAAGIKGSGRGKDQFRACEAHDVGISPAQDRGGATSAMGETEGEEGGVKYRSVVAEPLLRWRAFPYLEM